MYRKYNGVTRRDALKAGMLGGLALSMADLLRSEAQADENGQMPSPRSGIFIFLDGGQSHLDSWDMKPHNSEVAGEFRPIQTTLPGYFVCEHMPQLARQTGKYTVGSIPVPS